MTLLPGLLVLAFFLALRSGGAYGRGCLPADFTKDMLIGFGAASSDDSI